MALRVSINTKYPHEFGGKQWFCESLRLQLDNKNPVSGDLSSYTAVQLRDVAKAISKGTLIVTEGVMPVTYISDSRRDEVHTVVDGETIGAGDTFTSDEVDIAGSVEKSWYFQSDGTTAFTISMSPDGVSWVTYSSTTVNNTTAIVTHSTVGSMARLDVKNNGAGSLDATARLYARYA